MATKKDFIIKEAEITNNCTECFNQGLKLTFYQKHTFNAFFHKTTNEVTHKIECNKCGSVIYPAKWTDDIERVFNYYNKLVMPDRKSIRFTLLFYSLLLIFLMTVGVLIYLYLEEII